jgi:hypothetical protein
MTTTRNRCETFSTNATGLLSVPTSFYEQGTDRMPANQYSYEFNDRFFLDALSSMVIAQEKTNVPDQPTQISSAMAAKLLKRTSTFLVDVLNRRLTSNEVFLFNPIMNQITHASVIISDPLMFKIRTEHIVYRDTKLYGVGLWLETLHDPNKSNIKLTDFGLMGYVFEDRMTNVVPSNVLENVPENYKRENKILKDPKYEKAILCQYYRDLKKYKGITVDGYDKCQESSSSSS